MSPYEIIAIFISLIALIISIVSFFINKAASDNANHIAEKANSYAAQANSVALGNIELSINQMITSAKVRLSDLSITLSPLILKEDKTPKEEELLQKIFKSAIENTLNAYEEACAKYLDGKVDKERFMRLYKGEIRDLVKAPSHKEFLDTVASPYKAILKVYNEWENLEK